MELDQDIRNSPKIALDLTLCITMVTCILIQGPPEFERLNYTCDTDESESEQEQTKPCEL